MREEHPIDNQFREALFGAEVQPPTSVWEGVKNRRRRRGMAFWSRRRGLTIVTLFVALGAGAYWALHTDRERPQVDGLVANSTATADPVSVPKLETQNPGPDHSTTIPAATDPPHTGPNKVVRSSADRPAASQKMASIDPLIATNDAAVPSTSERLSTSQDVTVRDNAPVVSPVEEVPPTAPAAITTLHAGPVLRMNGLRTKWHGADHLLVPRTAVVPAYVLPNSEWWLAVQTGWYDVHRQWSGGSAELREALNASEAWNSTIGVGALIGRTWRSGWGFSVGAEHERSEQQFRYVDRTIGTAETIETMMVTLNTDVFYFNADTVVTQVVNEHIAEGTDRRSVLRIPVEGHWRGSWRRWIYGLGLGLAGEFTRTTSNSILVEDADGHITSVAPERGDLQERYPAVLLGSVSADVGYLLNERWALWASPAYMRSITAVTNGSDVHAEPERFGLRLRLSYTFNCSR